MICFPFIGVPWLIQPSKASIQHGAYESWIKTNVTKLKERLAEVGLCQDKDSGLMCNF